MCEISVSLSFFYYEVGEVMYVVDLINLCVYCVSVFFCQQDYCKSNQLISFELGKNPLTFDGYSIPDTDSG